jgi:hypothetical protein
MKPRIHPADEPKIRLAFGAAVNMTADELRFWLETPQSSAVGFLRRGETESVGRQAGRRNLLLLKTPADELTESDLVQMRRTVGFVKRHAAQRPSGDIAHSRWRFALMNWGHDPLRK